MNVKISKSELEANTLLVPYLNCLPDTQVHQKYVEIGSSPALLIYWPVYFSLIVEVNKLITHTPAESLLDGSDFTRIHFPYL